MKINKNSKTNNESKIIPISSMQLISSAPKIIPSYNDLSDVLLNAIDSGTDNFNIGVIGAFGTGKSSFLKTFKERNKKHKIVTVSLANFQNKNKPNDNYNGSSEMIIESEKYLESIIIQQILYSAKRFELPSSRIKRMGFRVRSIMLIAFFVLASIAFVLYDKIQLNQQFLWVRQLLFYSGVSFSVLSFIFFVLCFPLMSIAASFHGVQIKSEPNINSTLFDEYLDELIYFFHKTKTDVVIFEDIDRCSNDDIFNKLRTLNFTLNNSPYFKKQKIRFIYSVKEDLFISSETRSKFFDVLISLPPLMSKSNSYEHLSSVLDAFNVYKFDRRFIVTVGSFIDSYRQINNIVNDFMIFKMHKYKNRELEQGVAKRLFTILTFKSLFPYDYLLFIQGSGYLWHLVIAGKKDYGVKSDYNNVYINPTNSSVCKQIEGFYDSLIDYIDKSSISLVSLFVPDLYKSQEEKIFYDLIEDNNDYYAPEYVYEKAEDIIKNEKARDGFISSSFLNISIVRELIALPINNTLAGSFFESFNLATEKQALFIKCVINHLDDETDFCFAFFERTSGYYPHLINLLCETNFFDNSFYSKRLFKECLNDKSAITIQNKNGELISVINNSQCADEMICTLKSECVEYLLTLSIVVPRLNLEEFYKHNDNYKTNFVKISSSGKFKRDATNYIAFVKSISYPQNIDSNLPVIAQLFSIKTNEKTLQTKSSFIKFINDSKNDDFICGNDRFNLCDDKIIIEILNSITNKEVLNIIIDKCKIINIPNVSILSLPILKLLAAKEKMKASFSTWNLLCVGNEDVTNNFLQLIFTDFSLYLDNEQNKDSSYLTLLLQAINDERCNYALAGKIFELTCLSEALNVKDITNVESLKCAIDYKYCAFNKIDIGVIPESSIVSYFNNYREDIKKLDNASFDMDPIKLKNLLNVLENNDKYTAINKYVTSINKDNYFITDIVDEVEDMFECFSIKFIEMYLSSKYIFSKKKSIVLTTQYEKLENFETIIERLASDSIHLYYDDSISLDAMRKRLTSISNSKFIVRTSRNYFVIYKSNIK